MVMQKEFRGIHEDRTRHAYGILRSDVSFQRMILQGRLSSINLETEEYRSIPPSANLLDDRFGICTEASGAKAHDEGRSASPPSVNDIESRNFFGSRRIS